jgi:DNA-binding transcriptional ArsR family regulator
LDNRPRREASLTLKRLFEYDPKSVTKESPNSTALDMRLEILGSAMGWDESVEMTRVFGAMADPARLRLLSFLANAPRDLSVGELAELADSSISATSHHLRSAKQAGILQSRRFSQQVMYSLTTLGEVWMDRIEVSRTPP